MTYPAVTQYFTGRMWYMDVTVDAYDRAAWMQDELFRGMKARGYDIRILGHQKDFAAASSGAIDNAAIGNPKISSYSGLAKTMMQLVAFRYLPHGLKAGVWIAADELDQYLAPGTIYHTQDDVFYSKLLEHPIAATRTVPAFRYLHLNGMHLPFRLDENVKPVGGGEATSYQQGQAQFRILETIIAQLKAAEIYDNSAIIITADHGLRENRLTEITQPHNPVLLIKPRNSTHPFKISFQPMWMMHMKATMMDAAGLHNFADFGHSMLRPEDCPWEVRYFYPIVTADSQNELVEYEVTGEATYMNAWRKTGRTWHLGAEYFND